MHERMSRTCRSKMRTDMGGSELLMWCECEWVGAVAVGLRDELVRSAGF